VLLSAAHLCVGKGRVLHHKVGQAQHHIDDACMILIAVSTAVQGDIVVALP